MNKTKIEWTDYTWNPVVGCKHGCNYCYAKRMNDRFKWIEKWNKPQIFVERLDEPYKIKKPSKIFVCSVADLFGDWIGDDWIELIMKVTRDNPQHTFQFLTKNPVRYLDFNFPENCWLGATITGKNHKDDLLRLLWLSKVPNKNKRFVSIEPLLGKINQGTLLDNFDLVIVGAMTGVGAVPPKKEWIDGIEHKNIFYKNNIKKYL